MTKIRKIYVKGCCDGINIIFTLISEKICENNFCMTILMRLIVRVVRKKSINLCKSKN